MNQVNVGLRVVAFAAIIQAGIYHVHGRPAVDVGFSFGIAIVCLLTVIANRD